MPILRPSIWLFSWLAISSQRSARAGDAASTVAASRVTARVDVLNRFVVIAIPPLKPVRGVPARAAGGSQLYLTCFRSIRISIGSNAAQAFARKHFGQNP